MLATGYTLGLINIKSLQAGCQDFVIYQSGVFEDPCEIHLFDAFMKELIEYSRDNVYLVNLFEFIFRKQNKKTIDSIMEMIEESSSSPIYLYKRTGELIREYSNYIFPQNIIHAIFEIERWSSKISSNIMTNIFTTTIYKI